MDLEELRKKAEAYEKLLDAVRNSSGKTQQEIEAELLKT